MKEENLEVVSQEMMDEMKDLCKGKYNTPFDIFKQYDRDMLYLEYPQLTRYLNRNAFNERTQLKLIKHMWLNEPQFKAEKPKKYVIKYKELDYDDDPWFVAFNDAYSLKKVGYTAEVSSAAVFDTKEEAEKWTNPYTEVVEVEE